VRVHTLPGDTAHADDLFDTDETLHETFGVHHAALYLLRPDGYVAFCAPLDARAPDRLRAHLQRFMQVPPNLSAPPEP
jgi:hypothetical protein